ncbi:hypothetical protein EON65_29410 [archaeon]|nr:MAG: hypothetical protein EON65_29410 [archaeon]
MAELEISAATVGAKLAPFNPSHDEVVEIALDLMQLRSDDVLYDLGCGDARILVKVRAVRKMRSTCIYLSYYRTRHQIYKLVWFRHVSAFQRYELLELNMTASYMKKLSSSLATIT